MKIFILLRHYLPGYKSGGPVRTIANMVDHLGDQFQFWILTKDRDATDTKPYPNVQIDSWNQVGKARVYYASPTALSWRNVRCLTLDLNPDVVYLNSFLLPLSIKYLAMRRLGIVPDIPVILAPRGEFSPRFLQLKKAKRGSYMAVASLLGLYDDLIWQASSCREVEDIRNQWNRNVEIQIVPDVPAMPDLKVSQKWSKEKLPGQVKFAFVSRIAPVKNLLAALRKLQKVSGQIEFNIFGPVSDEKYWADCQNLIKQLPSNVVVAYGGSIPHEQVSAVLQEHHFFLLPTLGENFGHAIYEALVAGCPPIISDQTVWRELSTCEAGWDIPLSHDRRWHEVLQQCVNMGQETYDNLSANAQQYVQQWLSHSDILQSNVQLFLSAVKNN
jgi:glycosyltransferase involved in cell wall biosynthesis